MLRCISQQASHALTPHFFPCPAPQLGADLVSIFNDQSGYCGEAWTLGNSDGNYAYSSVLRGCWNSLSLAHETGHNQVGASSRVPAAM